MSDEEKQALNDNTEESNAGESNDEAGEGKGFAESLYEESNDSGSEDDKSQQENTEESNDDKPEGEGAKGEGDDEGDDESEGIIGKKLDDVKNEDKDSENGEKKPDDAKAPEKIELSLSENSSLDKSDVERVSEFATEKKLTQKEADNLLSISEKAVEDYKTRFESDKPMRDKQFVKDASDKWLEKSMESPNFKEDVTYANRFLEAEFSQDFQELVRVTGIGNNDEFIKNFGGIGKRLYAEDKYDPGGDSNLGGKKELSFAEELFGKNE